MKKTEELLRRLTELVRSGRLPAEDVPAADIKDCVSAELKLYESTFLREQYLEVQRLLESFCALYEGSEKSRKQAEMFLTGMLLCLQTVSETVLSLANRSYWEKMHKDELDQPEISEIIDYIDRKGDIRLLNYDFVDHYMELDCEVFYDAVNGMHYLLHKGHPMYFPKGWDESRIRDYYRSLLAEQDAYSPHCYHKPGYEIAEGDVILDIGAAEGIFALNHLHEAGSIYLLEANPEWVEALQLTFREDMDKVKIIQGYVGKRTEGDSIALDDLFKDIEIDYIKMDIEGYEKDALEGATGIFERSRGMICALCAYHCREDEAWITAFLQKRGYSTTHSRGYICPDWTVEGRIGAELRRGIVFGKK